jgi:hypothetical protein
MASRANPTGGPVKYHVTVKITFEIEADNAEGAEERYLRDGDEIHSETVSTEVVLVEEVL